jgi:hypothetical protein
MLGWAITILMFAIILGILIADTFWQRWALAALEKRDGV